MYLGYYSNLCIGLGGDECFSLGTMRGGKRIYNKYLLLHFVCIIGIHIVRRSTKGTKYTACSIFVCITNYLPIRSVIYFIKYATYIIRSITK